MNLNLSDEQLSAVIGAAVLQSITPENRDKLIGEAVRSLLVPQSTNVYGGKAKSSLQVAFEQATEMVAREQVTAKLKDDPQVRQMIDGVISDAIKLALEKNRDETVNKIADGITSYLTFKPDRY